jgi:hypothetical protein
MLASPHTEHESCMLKPRCENGKPVTGLPFTELDVVLLAVSSTAFLGVSVALRRLVRRAGRDVLAPSHEADEGHVMPRRTA